MDTEDSRKTQTKEIEMLKKRYKICIIADWQALQLMTGEGIKKHVEQQICKDAAAALKTDYNALKERAEITYCEIGKLHELDLDSYDYVRRFEEKPSAFPYLSRLMDTTYDTEPVTVTGGDGTTVVMAFGLYKEYLRRLCVFVANLAKSLNRAEEMTQIYEKAVGEFDEELAATAPGKRGNIYDVLNQNMTALDDEIINVYAKTWEMLAIQLENLMLLPPAMQENILGRTLVYNKEKLTGMTDEFLTAATGIDGIQQDNEYDFVMETFMAIYTKNK